MIRYTTHGQQATVMHISLLSPPDAGLGLRPNISQRRLPLWANKNKKQKQDPHQCYCGARPLRFPFSGRATGTSTPKRKVPRPRRLSHQWDPGDRYGLTKVSPGGGASVKDHRREGCRNSILRGLLSCKSSAAETWRRLRRSP